MIFGKDRAMHGNIAKKGDALIKEMLLINFKYLKTEISEDGKIKIGGVITTHLKKEEIHTKQSKFVIGKSTCW